MRKVKDSQEARELYFSEQRNRDAQHESHAGLQWKGTDACMDIWCKCGCHSHLDSDFAYNVQCPNCKTWYRCNPSIELIELEEPPNPDKECVRYPTE